MDNPTVKVVNGATWTWRDNRWHKVQDAPKAPESDNSPIAGDPVKTPIKVKRTKRAKRSERLGPDEVSKKDRALNPYKSYKAPETPVLVSNHLNGAKVSDYYKLYRT